MRDLKRNKAMEVLRLLDSLYPDVVVGFDFRTPFKSLVTTMLSAQTTDRQTGPVAENLFEFYPTAETMSEAPVELLEEKIRAVGLYRTKARNIRKTARMILDRYGGKVPDTMEGLLTLPGVGRKTANIVLSSAFGKNEGIAVDTHVYRISRRIGLAVSKDRDKVELELVALYPREKYLRVNHLLIHHGRVVCNARRPRCAECVISHLCDNFENDNEG